MGLFGKITGGGSAAPFTPPEAFAAVMLAVAAADGDISDEERDDFVARANRINRTSHARRSRASAHPESDGFRRRNRYDLRRWEPLKTRSAFSSRSSSVISA